jgi:hypothetical protein
LCSDVPGQGKWHRSSKCQAGGCVEVSTDGSVVLVRNSADPEGATLAIGRGAWRDLIARIQAGLENEGGI